MKVKLLRIGIAVFLFLSIIGSDLFSALPVSATGTDTWIVYGGTGSGDWSDTNHWSTGIVPTATDDVVFGASSFNANGQTVTLTASSYCNNMDWSGVTFTSTKLDIAYHRMYVNGNLTLNPDVNIYNNFSAGYFTFTTSGGTQTITSNGGTFGDTGHSLILNFEGTGGTVNLGDNLVGLGFLTQLTLSLPSLFFNTNNHSITCPVISISSGATVNLGSSVIACEGWSLSGVSNLNAGTSFISVSESASYYLTFDGGGATYNNVSFLNHYYTISGNNTFNNLNIDRTAGEIDFTAGSTQTCTSFTAPLSGTTNLNLISTSLHTAWNLIQTSGTVNTDYVTMSDSHASGGATFNAGVHSTDVSGNTGWTFSSPPARYWVGNSGDWSDATDHWATSSGGTPNIANVPTALTNVHFDGNSFVGGVETVTSTYPYMMYCKDMDWTGATGNPSFNSGGLLYISGNLTLIGNMAFNAAYTWMDSSTTADITTNGVAVLTGITISGTGTFNLEDDFTTTVTNNSRFLGSTAGATFNTNNHNMTVGDLGLVSGTFDNLGTSTINIPYSNDSTAVDTILFAGTMTGTETLNMQTGSNPWCSGIAMRGTFYDVNVTSRDTNRYPLDITGASTFHNLSVSGVTPLPVSGNLIVSNNLTLTGTNSINGRLILESDTQGTQRQLTCTGTVNITDSNVSDMAGAGTASWDISAGLNTDNGDNQNITFTTGENVYWVGNSGNWSDVTSHWASTSGGTAGTGRLPLEQDTAIFDADSFSLTGSTVTMDATYYSSIDTTTVTKNPTIGSGGGGITYGNVSLGTVTWNESLTFMGGDDSTLTSNSVINGTINVNKNSATMSNLFLGSNVDIVGTVYLTSGTLDLSGYNLTASYFNSWANGYARHFIMGSGVIQLNGTDAQSKWAVTSYNFTLTCGTSVINLSNSTSNSQSFTGGGLTYYDVEISGTGNYQTTFTDSNTFNQLMIDRSQAAKTIASSGYTITTASFVSPIHGTTVLTIYDVHFIQTTGTVILDYLSFTSGDNTCPAAGGATFYAGAHSTGSPQTGWSFTSPALPLVSTISATWGTITATLYGQVTAMGSYGTVYAGFLYGTDPTFAIYTTSTPLTTISGTSPSPFHFDATPLTNGVTYYYEAIVTDGSIILAYGAPASFMTGGPKVTTLAASNETQTSAILNLNYDIGNQSSVIVQFEWGLTTSYGQLTTPQIETVASGSWSYNLDSTNGIILNGGVTYHYQAILSYDGPGSPVYGIDKTFDTLALDKPIAPAAPGSITLGQGQTYQKMLGPTLSGALDTCGKAVGTDGRGFGGGLTFIVCVIILIFCSARGYPVAGLALGYPLQLVSAWVGLWDWAFVGVVTFILALIWVKATWLDK